MVGSRGRSERDNGSKSFEGDCPVHFVFGNRKVIEHRGESCERRRSR